MNITCLLFFRWLLSVGLLARGGLLGGGGRCCFVLSVISVRSLPLRAQVLGAGCCRLLSCNVRQSLVLLRVHGRSDCGFRGGYAQRRVSSLQSRGLRTGRLRCGNCLSSNDASRALGRECLAASEVHGLIDRSSNCVVKVSRQRTV